MLSELQEAAQEENYCRGSPWWNRKKFIPFFFTLSLVVTAGLVAAMYHLIPKCFCLPCYKMVQSTTGDVVVAQV